ncbi:MAG: hypothetical protein Q7K11_01005 [Candidatus Berkelbacteria bacterium]|nr:hypothetical protein [Candidatus Berkelbacteria bacterium]
MKERKFEFVAALFVSGVATFILLSILAVRLGILGWLISFLAGGTVGYFYYCGGEVVKGFAKALRLVVPAICEGIDQMNLIAKAIGRSFLDIIKRPRAGTLLNTVLIISWLGYAIHFLTNNNLIFPDDRNEMFTTFGLEILVILAVSFNLERRLRSWLLGWNKEFLTQHFDILSPFMEGWYRGDDFNRCGIGANYRKEYNNKKDIPVRVFLRNSSSGLPWNIYLTIWKEMLLMGCWILPLLWVQRIGRSVKASPGIAKLFLITLFREIHCRTRVIVGIYGPLGGLITWILLGRYFPEMTLWTRLLVTLGAGFMSVILGRVLGSIVVAKKIFGIQPNGN